MKYTFLLIILIASHISAHCQIVYNDSEPYITESELYKLGQSSILIIDSLKAKGLNCQRADIVELGDYKYLLPDGSFDVFRYERGRWINRYKNGFSGYNFGSKKFIYNNEIYSFGGYGFWNNHGQVIRFIEERSEWEILPFTQNLNNGFCTYNPPLLKVYTTDSITNINLETQEVTSFSNQLSEINKYDLSNINTYELRNYSLQLGRKPYFTFTKENNTVFTSKLTPYQNLRLARLNGILHIIGDSINCYSDKFETIGKYNSGEELQQFEILESKDRSQSNDVLWIKTVTILTTFLGSLLLFIIIRKKSRLVNTNNELNENPKLKMVMNYKGQTLDQEALDEIFEISHIQSAESKRFRRAQLIKELNTKSQIKYSADVIKRKRDPDDGRKFVYQILP